MDESFAVALDHVSLSFDASFHEMFACWGSGGTLVVPGEWARRDMAALAALLVESRIVKAILPVVVLQQLAEGGRMVLPIGSPDNQMLTIVENVGGEIRKRGHSECKFVKLVGKYAWEPWGS